MKAYLMLLMSLVMMFFISWKLTFVILGCFLLIGIVRLICFIVYSKRAKENKNLIKELNAISESKLESTDEYSDKTKKYHKLN